MQNLKSMSQPPQPRFAQAVEDLAMTKGQGRRPAPSPSIMSQPGKTSRRSAREQSERGRQVEYSMKMERYCGMSLGIAMDFSGSC